MKAKATEAQIDERLPVWEALSELFLDTELQPDDYERIARILAASSYKESEIEGILIGEVCPTCKWNMMTVAGEWAGFDRDWLREKVSPRLGKRPGIRSLYVFMNRWMYARKWNKVRARIVEMRKQ
jgi:hypothetical protein